MGRASLILNKFKNFIHHTVDQNYSQVFIDLPPFIENHFLEVKYSLVLEVFGIDTMSQDSTHVLDRILVGNFNIFLILTILEYGDFYELMRCPAKKRVLYCCCFPKMAIICLPRLERTPLNSFDNLEMSNKGYKMLPRPLGNRQRNIVLRNNDISVTATLGAFYSHGMLYLTFPCCRMNSMEYVQVLEDKLLTFWESSNNQGLVF